MTGEQIKKVALALMYETAWQEDEFNEKVLRTWKGYLFEILNELDEEGYIWQSKGSKSVIFTDKGENTAKEIVKELEKIL